MTFARAFRVLLSLAAALVVVWAFVDAGARLWQRVVMGADGRSVTLTVLHWGSPEESDIVEDLVRAFEAENPDIAVQRLHATDYDAKLKTMLAAGTPPDLFYLRYDDTPEFASKRVVMPVDDAVEQAWLDLFFPQLIDAFRSADPQGNVRLFGIPKDFTPMLMYVNLDLFEAAGVDVPYDGWTWDEYRDAVGRIAEHGASDDPAERVYGGLLKTWPLVLRNIIWQFGGDYFGGTDGRDYAELRLTDPGTVAALDMVRAVRFDDGSVYNATGISESEDDLFRRGRIATAGPLGRWVVPRYRKIEEFRWDVVPLPHVEGVEPSSALATVAWAVSAQTPHPAEAKRLMKFLCGEPGQLMTAELGLAMPSMKHVAESDAFLSPGQQPENAELFVRLAAEQGRLAPQPNNYQEFDRILSREVQKTLQLDSKTPRDAMATAEQDWADERASPLKSQSYPLMPWGKVGVAAAVVIAALLAVLYWFARREPLSPLARAQQRAGWLFVSPWVIGFVLLVAGPMVISLLLALTKWSAMVPLGQAEFVGLDNFVHLFKYDKQFGQSLWVTVYYTILAVPIVQVAALAVALLMNQSVKGIGLFRTAYFVPSVVTGVALVTLWITIFNNDTGMLNALLRYPLELFGLEPPDWFGTNSRWFAVPALVLMTLWGVGGGMVIYLAGLKGIPSSLYEAARIDGASHWRQFLAVTVPMLSPLIFFNVVMGIIGSFQVFTQAYVIRGSNGAQNEDLLFYVLNLYDHAFRFHNMGYASAMAWVLFLILLGLTLIVFRGSKNMVHYEGLKA